MKWDEMISETEKFKKYFQSELGRKVLQEETSYLRRELWAAERILDVGCGIGVFELELSDLNIVGIDHSWEMLQEAKSIGIKKLALCTAENLCFRDGSFDGAFAVTTLEFLENLEEAVSEISRVLSPSGRFVVMALNPVANYFKEHHKRRNSYFRKIKHSPERIEIILQKYFNTKGEYFLGIEEQKVFKTSDKRKAALYAIKSVKPAF